MTNLLKDQKFTVFMAVSLLWFAYITAMGWKNKEFNKGTINYSMASLVASDVSEKDAKFIVEAYKDGLYEVEFCEYAKNKIVSQEVKKLADHMITAHKKVNTTLKNLAMKKNITLPSSLEKEMAEKMHEGDKKEGIEYDGFFTDMLIDNHEKAVKLYKEAAEESSDADIRKFFSTTVPELQEHLEMAKQAKNHVKS